MLTVDAAQMARWQAWRAQAANGDTSARTMATRRMALEIRRLVVTTITRSGLGHVGGDLSVADILAVLYGAVLRVDPADPGWPDRDRFVLSKGHCAVSLYSALALAGFFPPAELAAFAAPSSPLNGHPNRVEVPGVETNTGPLGHGLPFAVGCAIGARLDGSARRVVVVLGDGELQEGSNWEAAMTAGHRGLSNLTAIVDRNRLQQGARTEETNGLAPLADRWAAFGWEAVEVDGHDHAALYAAVSVSAGGQGRPRCVIANTVKGKGVSFMEDRVEWHHKVPTAQQAEAALQELQGLAR
jgi:transketolase